MSMSALLDPGEPVRLGDSTIGAASPQKNCNEQPRKSRLLRWLYATSKRHSIWLRRVVGGSSRWLICCLRCWLLCALVAVCICCACMLCKRFPCRSIAWCRLLCVASVCYGQLSATSMSVHRRPTVCWVDLVVLLDDACLQIGGATVPPCVTTMTDLAPRSFGTTGSSPMT